jgi:hypothetical protein
MSHSLHRFHRYVLFCLCTTALAGTAAPAHAQSVGVRGFATVGSFTFTAEDSFKAILDKNDGIVYGGGAEVLLPFMLEPLAPNRSDRIFAGHFFGSIGAWQFKHDGERVFVGPGDEVFRLGIPVTVTITPIELTAGYRFSRFWRRVAPYVGAGYSSYRYQETSEFADDNANENVDERFPGWHVVGGVEYQPFRWLGIGGEVTWSSIADALGEGGVSEHYNEDNLGGTSFRLKISVGR